MTNADGPGVIRGEGVTVWRQVEERLRHAIETGELPRAGRLPPEKALADRFGVNRHTVRRAMAALAERGLIRTEQGRGSYVQDVVVDYPLRRRTSFSANLLAQDRLPSHAVLSIEATAASSVVAGALGLEVGAPVAHVTSIGQADGVPISFARSFLPIPRLPDVLERLHQEPSMSRVYAACGVSSYRRLWTRITARMPSAEEALHLKQARNLPVLMTEAVDVGQDRQPIRYGLACFASARVQLTVEPDEAPGPLG